MKKPGDPNRGSRGPSGVAGREAPIEGPGPGGPVEWLGGPNSGARGPQRRGLGAPVKGLEGPNSHVVGPNRGARGSSGVAGRPQ